MAKNGELWYLGIGFTVATIFALPAMVYNRLGKRLDEIGFASSFSLQYSITNVRPNERLIWRPILDYLVTVTLAITFIYTNRVADRIEQKVRTAAPLPTTTTTTWPLPKGILRSVPRGEVCAWQVCAW